MAGPAPWLNDKELAKPLMVSALYMYSIFSDIVRRSAKTTAPRLRCRFGYGNSQVYKQFRGNKTKLQVRVSYSVSAQWEMMQEHGTVMAYMVVRETVFRTRDYPSLLYFQRYMIWFRLSVSSFFNLFDHNLHSAGSSSVTLTRIQPLRWRLWPPTAF